MKILLVIDQYDNANNGTTISTRRFADVLRQHGNEVRIVSTGEKKQDKYLVEELYIPIIDRVIKNQGVTLAKPDAETLRTAISWADIVHFLMPFWLSVKGQKIAEEMGIPYTAAFHVQPENISYNFGLGEIQQVNSMIYKTLRPFYNKFNHIHCPSQFIASELKRNGYSAKFHIISNGVEAGFDYRKLPKHPSLSRKFVIVMIGRLSSEKRQDVLIEAVKKSKYAKNIQLVLAGKGPKQKEYARLGNMLDNPVIMDFFDSQKLKDQLAMADLYVHAADAEIEAISCIEAFSSGLVPIISNSKKSATPQFALDERSLFTRGDSGDLAAKIDYWIDHESERREMEIKYAEYGKQFNINKCVNKIEDMFREAISETREKTPIKNMKYRI